MPPSRQSSDAIDRRIRKLAAAGRQPEQIAAQLMLGWRRVADVLARPSVPSPAAPPTEASASVPVQIDTPVEPELQPRPACPPTKPTFSIDAVALAKHHLLSRGYVILAAGSGAYRVDRQVLTAEEMVAKANRSLRSMGRPPLTGQMGV